MKRLISILAALIIAATALHAIPSRPEPQRLVNDYAYLFANYQTEELERMLVAFDDSTSNQIAVISTKDLEGYPISEYATRIGIEWQVGSEKFDNGIVIVIKPKTAASSGQVFIAVGYGLEGAIPDAYAKRIINDIMIPHFMEYDYYGGVAAACEVLMKLASGEISEELRDSYEDDTEGAMAVIFFILLIIVLTIIFTNNHSDGGNRGRRPTIYTGPVITSGNNYGGFRGGGFGGFGGGGFGGFGGGSFGGGGAGGSW